MTGEPGAEGAPRPSAGERAQGQDVLGLGERERDALLAWVGENLTVVRRSAYGQRTLYWSLGICFVVGLAAHVGGFLLKTWETTEPGLVLADLLYTLGWALWTGVVVVVFIQLYPETKRRQYKQALDAYEAARGDQAQAGSLMLGLILLALLGEQGPQADHRIRVPGVGGPAVPPHRLALLALLAKQDRAIPGSGPIARRRLVGIEGLLELTSFRLRIDLGEHHHDGTGPQCPAERVEQVAQHQQRLRRHRGLEQESADMSGQAHHKADPEGPVQDPLPGNRPPHQRQVLAHPVE